MPTYQVVRTTTDKLQVELNRPGPHQLVSTHHVGGRDWVVITRGAPIDVTVKIATSGERK